MNKIKLTREELEEICDGDFPWGAKHIELHDTTRWGEVHEVIFECEDGTCWRTYFEYGVGDSAYNSWDYTDALECVQVEAMQVLVTKWFDVE